MNKKKIVMIAAAVFILGAMSTTALVISMLNGSGGLPSGPATGEEAWENETPNYEGEFAFEPIGDTIGDAAGETLQAGQAEAILTEMRRLISEYKFEDAEKYMLNAISTYKVEGTEAFEQLIQPVRQDLPGLSQLDYLYEYQEIDTMVEIINSLSDPTNVLVGTLWFEPQLREKILLSGDSINPVFTQISSIGAAQRVKNTIPDYPEAEYMYLIPFELDGNPLTATIVDISGWLYFYSISSTSENHPYVTINEWNALREEMLGTPDAPAQDGEISEGITEEEEAQNPDNEEGN